MIAEKQVRSKYDEDHDILYIDVGEPCAAYSEEIDNGVFLRINPQNDKPVGMTILTYKNKNLKNVRQKYPSFFR